MLNCLGASLIFALTSVLFIRDPSTVSAWPDGAPCLRAVLDSMNPQEAVEHQGGLQLSPPPFRIELSDRCYRFNEPIQVTLRGNSTSHAFKGFALQAHVHSEDGTGGLPQRVGSFLRLDDNGSWQRQCFKNRSSVTHSHEVPKKRIAMWWKYGELEAEGSEQAPRVQFVATVVESLKRFWVRSVLSTPIPPCGGSAESGKRATKRALLSSSDPPTTAIASTSPAVTPLAPPTMQSGRPRLTHIIPLEGMETNKSPKKSDDEMTPPQVAPRFITLPIMAGCRDVGQAQCLQWTTLCEKVLLVRRLCPVTCQTC